MPHKYLKIISEHKTTIEDFKVENVSLFYYLATFGAWGFSSPLKQTFFTWSALCPVMDFFSSIKSRNECREDPL